MSREAADQHPGLSFFEARQHILDAVQATRGLLNDPALAPFLHSDRDITFVELEFDSLTAIEFCLEIEDRIGIEIDPGDLLSNPSVNALSSLLRSKRPRDA